MKKILLLSPSYMKLRYGEVKPLAQSHTVEMVEVIDLSSMTSIFLNDKINHTHSHILHLLFSGHSESHGSPYVSRSLSLLNSVWINMPKLGCETMWMS